jgi:hypothetical protein
MNTSFVRALFTIALLSAVATSLIAGFLFLAGEGVILLPSGSRFLFSAGFAAIAVYFMQYTARLGQIQEGGWHVSVFRLRGAGVPAFVVICFAGMRYVLRYLAAVIDGDVSEFVPSDALVFVGLLVMSLLLLAIALSHDSRQRINADAEQRSLAYPGLALTLFTTIYSRSIEYDVLLWSALFFLCLVGLAMVVSSLMQWTKTRMCAITNGSPPKHCGWPFYVLGKAFVALSMLVFILVPMSAVSDGIALLMGSFFLIVGLFLVYFIALAYCSVLEPD